MIARWASAGGYREVLRIGLPLVASMASTTVMQFTDRIFLGNYSLEAIAASLPAGITSFLFISFFMGVASYVNVFIAQYTGSGAKRRLGAALWQGIWFGLAAWVILALLGLAAEPLFDLGGHPAPVRELEVVYFRVLSCGAGFAVLSVALSCFYSGRGITRPVMLVNLLGAALNIPLDYALIYGLGPLPDLGIVGAGLATAVSQLFTALLYCLLIFSPANELRFGVRSGARPDAELFRRLMRFGLPGGVQFFLEIFAITFFVFMVGRLGTVELAATNIVFSIDSLAFLPMIGLSVAASTMVGQAIGKGNPGLGARATYSALHITMVYMALIMAMFLLIPRELISLYQPAGQDPAEAARVMEMSVVLLRLVAVYCLFDGIGIIFSGALKGAGDSRFVMYAISAVAVFVMIVPVYVLVDVLRLGVYWVWPTVTIYICVLGAVLWLRFKGGRWRSMRVIEERPEPG